MDATASRSRVLAPGEGLRLQSGPGRDLIFKVTGEDTGGAFDTPVLGGLVSGSVAGSEAVIVRSEPLRVPVAKGEVTGSAVSILRAADAPTIPGCAA